MAEAIIIAISNIFFAILLGISEYWEGRRIMTTYYKALTEGGKTSCKYYKVCGNTENCKRCVSYEKKEEKKK